MIPAHESLQRLREGNLRFASNARGHGSFLTDERRAELTAGQEPHAIILGCSDSRVPAEIVFDQGLGDLFVIRVAGNIVAPSQIGTTPLAGKDPLDPAEWQNWSRAARSSAVRKRPPSE